MHAPLLALLVLFAALAGCATYSKHLQAGDAFAGAKDYERAEQAYERALADHPESSEARARLDSLRQRWARDELARAEAARAKGDLPAAAPHYRRAHGLWPGSGADHALAKALETELAKAAAHLGAGRISEAAAAFDLVLRVDPSHAQAQRGSTNARAALTQELMTAAEAYERRGLLGNAFVAYLRAEALDVRAAEARQRSDALRRRLLDELTFTIEATFATPGHTLAPKLDDALAAQRLDAFLPEGLLTRVVPNAGPGSRGVRLYVSVEDAKVERKKATEERIWKFLAGRHMAQNPKWAALDDKLNQAERALEESEANLAAQLTTFEARERQLADARHVLERCWNAALRSCSEALDECYEGVTKGAGSERCRTSALCTKDACKVLADAAERHGGLYEESRLALAQAQKTTLTRREGTRRAREERLREPSVKDQPAYGQFPYEVERHTVTARLGVAFSVAPLSGGRGPPAGQTWREEFSATAEDTTHRGYPMYGIAADLLELKAEPELYRESADKALRAAATRIGQEVEKWRAAYREEARRGLAAQQPSAEAVESAVRTVLLYPKDRQEDITRALARTVGLTDVSSLYSAERVTQ